MIMNYKNLMSYIKTEFILIERYSITQFYKYFILISYKIATIQTL